MKMTILQSITAAVLCVTAPSSPAATTADQLIGGLAEREQNIKSLRARFHLRAYMLIGGNLECIEKSYEWLFDENHKKLCEESLSVPPSLEQGDPNTTKPGQKVTRTEISNRISAFDGELTKTYYINDKQGYVQSGDNMPTESIPGRWLALRLGDQTLSGFLKQEGTSVAYGGPVDLDGRSCEKIRFSKNDKVSGTLMLIVENGLAPVQLETLTHNASAAFDTKVSYKASQFADSGGLWLPRQIEVTMWHVYPDKDVLVNREIVTVTDLQLNTKIPPEDLTITFAPGTHVYDSVLNIDYIVPE